MQDQLKSIELESNPKSTTSTAGTRNYSALNPEKVAATINCLKRRISERFPEAGLSQVCQELAHVCERSTQRIEWIARPHWPLRILRYSLIALFVIGLLVGLYQAKVQILQLESLSLVDMVQALEATMNNVVLISLALFFVWNLEFRIKRKRALKALHELRSIAHIIDMHQLTKDPERFRSSHKPTESSPEVTLTPFEMRRYLDYCAEMLSLVGKVAALYLRDMDEPTVVAAVNEVEILSTGLSRKIWQKIELIKPDV